MEFTKCEANAIEVKTIEAEGIALKELSDLQLVMVGGGNGFVIIG